MNLKMKLGRVMNLKMKLPLPVDLCILMKIAHTYACMNLLLKLTLPGGNQFVFEIHETSVETLCTGKLNLWGRKSELSLVGLREVR